EPRRAGPLGGGDARGLSSRPECGQHDLLAQHPPCLLWGEAGLETGQRDRLERLQSPAVGLGREDQLAGGAGAAHPPVVRADGEGEAEVGQATGPKVLPSMSSTRRTPWPMRSAPQSSASAIEEGPSASPAWMVTRTPARRASSNWARNREAGKPASGPARSMPTTPVSRRVRAISTRSSLGSRWRR